MALNILNRNDISSYLHQTAEGDEYLGSLLTLALERALTKEETLFDIATSYPNPAPDWLTPAKWKQGGPFHVFNPESAEIYADKIRHIKDWLAAAVHNNAPWLDEADAKGRKPARLYQIGTLEQAYNFADKDMKIAASILRQQFILSANDDTEEKEGHIRTVKTFEDGSRIVELLTPTALDKETALLGHCIGNGGYDEVVGSKGYRLYSLRDVRGKPHVTMEVCHVGPWPRLRQCQGKENAMPVTRYIPAIQSFVREQGINVGQDVGHTNLIRQNGIYYDISKLPEGFVITGDVTITGVKRPLKLPDNLVIKGHLTIIDCPGLTSLPKNLSVGCKMDMKNCNNLTGFPENLSVGRLNISQCNALTKIAEHITVGDECSIKDCAGVTMLSDTISAGYVSARDCDHLRVLADDLSVGTLCIYFCNQLDILPENLRIDSKFPVKDCEKTIPLRLNLGNMYINNCHGLTALPESTTIDNDFIISDCPGIKSLPDTISVGGKVTIDSVELSLAEAKKLLKEKHDPQPAPASKPVLLPLAILPFRP